MAHRVLMPRFSQDMETGRIVEWLKSEGDAVTRGETLLVVDADKATVEVASPESGILQRVHVQVGDDAEIGALLATISAADEPPAIGGAEDDRPPVETASQSQSAAASGGERAAALPSAAASDRRRPSSPAARRLAQKLGVEMSLVDGTGDNGLITEADIEAYASRSVNRGTDRADPDDRDEVIPVSGMRRRIAERMARSRRTAADVTTVVDVDMTNVTALHATTGISYTAYVAWAASRTLREFPILNASFADNEIHVRRDINLGVAVSLEDGLVVPVIRAADTKSAGAIASEIDELSTRVRGGELRPEDLTGATFTVTNSGGYGSLFFTPIINLPEVAILGMGRVADAPIVRDGVVVAGKVMYLCLTYDHRAVDGAPAVKFLSAVKRRLESAAEGT